MTNLTPDSGGAPQSDDHSIAARLKEVLNEQTYAEIARATGCNSETVRRYMHGGTPSVAFIIGVARHYGISPGWLLLGQGQAYAPGVGRGVAARRGGRRGGGGPSPPDGGAHQEVRPVNGAPASRTTANGDVAYASGTGGGARRDA